jgi:predicted PurR-regulated permease PerM
VQPIATALFLAAFLAGILWPLQQGLSRRVRGKRGVAAGLLVFGVVVAMVGSVGSLSAFVVKEVAEGVTFVARTVRSDGATALLDKLPASLQRVARAGIERIPREPGADIDKSVEKQVTAQSAKVAAGVTSFVTATGSLLFHAAMMVVALFFLLVHGHELVTWLDRNAPLKPGQTEELLSEMRRVSNAVFLSSVVTAAIQAAVSLGGYLIARVPHPISFAAITFFIAFIPAIGAASVCLAAALLVLNDRPRFEITA